MSGKAPDPLATLGPAALAAVGARTCSRCGIPKPLDCFRPDRRKPGRTYSACRTCERIGYAEYRQTARGVLARAAYLARPEVVEARREHERRRGPIKQVSNRAYRQTTRGRLNNARGRLRGRLREETDPARRAHLGAMIAEYTRLIEALKRREDS